MRADRCVNAAWLSQIAGADDLIVQGLAHAVQALEFVIADAVAFRPRVNDGQRLRVVRGKLRIDHARRAQQLLRADEVGHIGVDLARVDRIAAHAVHLGALDFRVPIGAFHQPHHELAATASRQVDQIIDHERAALLIRLHHKTDAVKTGQLGIEGHGFHQVERQFQTIDFFGIDVQADIVFLCQQHQRPHARQQLLHHACPLSPAVARMQRR